MKHIFFLLLLIGFSICLSCNSESSKISNTTKKISKNLNNYTDLENLFVNWRTFENPPKNEGAPDYTKKSFENRWPKFLELRSTLLSIDTTNWSIDKQVDWMIVWAEMNGYDFNHNILKPWNRDPAFYKSVWSARSDVPAHEGPTHHHTTELWTYQFPLNKSERIRLISDLQVIPSLNKQAQYNLTGNAKDLWITGIRDIERQSIVLNELKNKDFLKTDTELISHIDHAIVSTNSFVTWLKQEAASKTGPSGIGRDNYTWYMQNVHLVPLTWSDEVMILKRELARAWSSLKLEEHRNRNIPQLKDAISVMEYEKLADEGATSLINFLDKQEIVSVKPYFDTALREHLGSYVPREQRNFFLIGEHYDPRPLYSHFYHWFELARMDTEPNPSLIRRGPLLYNNID